MNPPIARQLILHSPTDEIVGVENAGKIYSAARHPKSFHSLAGADHLLTAPAQADYAAGIIAAGNVCSPYQFTHAGDMIGAISIANCIHPYPAQGEAIRKVGDLYNKTRLTPRVAAIMKKVIAWQR